MAIKISDDIVIDDEKNIINIENLNSVGIITAITFEGSYEGNFFLDSQLF